MNRYKLVVSDFHIGSGRLMEDGEVNPLEDFIFDNRFIDFLDYYSTGDFKKAEVELVLNGDFLNTLQVDYREEFPTDITEEVALSKTRRIFEGHPELFDALRDFAAVPRHSITYVVGNHDPAIHWPAVREDISSRLGTEVQFPGFSYKFDGVWVEHGHQYTAANRFDPAKLFVKMPDGKVVLNLPWGCIWVIDYLNKINRDRPYIDRVQPFGRYLFFAAIFEPTFAIKAISLLVWFFIKERVTRGKWRKPKDIKKTLDILSRLSIVPRLDGPAREILSKPGYHTVIFGHNHQAAYRRYGKEKLFVNVGTWNDIIHLDIQNLGRQRRMTYAFIEYLDKKKPSTRLKLWKGTRQPHEDVIF